MLQPDPNERFRERRSQARRRRARQRLAAFAILAVGTAVVALGARFLEEGDGPPAGAAPTTTAASPQTATEAAPPAPRELPEEVRGVHVTMGLMTLRGKLDEYLGLAGKGLTAIQVDVKDENGEVAFRSPLAPLATKVGAAQDYYRPEAVARKAHARGIYLIGRVVVFEDPFLARNRPRLAVQRAGGGIWTNYGGLGWSNQYDERVWDYNVDVAEAAARAGFDEIMFDYVRFPSDGPIELARWPGRVNEKKGETIARFLAYARERLEPLGVRVSAAVFGLAATRDLGIGQRPRLLAPHLDAIYPMVYPSHYSPGEYDLPDPNGMPAATVTMALRDFRRVLRGADTLIIPWLQDFSIGKTYGPAEVRAQITAARKLTPNGYLLWNAAGVYTSGGLAAAP
jgi:hypothetical protein